MEVDRAEVRPRAVELQAVRGDDDVVAMDDPVQSPGRSDEELVDRVARQQHLDGERAAEGDALLEAAEARVRVAVTLGQASVRDGRERYAEVVEVAGPVEREVVDDHRPALRRREDRGAVFQDPRVPGGVCHVGAGICRGERERCCRLNELIGLEAVGVAGLRHDVHRDGLQVGMGWVGEVRGAHVDGMGASGGIVGHRQRQAGHSASTCRQNDNVTAAAPAAGLDGLDTHQVAASGVVAAPTNPQLE